MKIDPCLVDVSRICMDGSYILLRTCPDCGLNMSDIRAGAGVGSDIGKREGLKYQASGHTPPRSVSPYQKELYG